MDEIRESSDRYTKIHGWDISLVNMHKIAYRCRYNNYSTTEIASV